MHSDSRISCFSEDMKMKMDSEGYMLPSNPSTYSRQKNSALPKDHHQGVSSRKSAEQQQQQQQQQQQRVSSNKNHEYIRSIHTINGCRLYILKNRAAEDTCQLNGDSTCANSDSAIVEQQERLGGSSEMSVSSILCSKAADAVSDASKTETDSNNGTSDSLSSMSTSPTPSPTAKSPVKHSTLNPKASLFVLKEPYKIAATSASEVYNSYITNGVYKNHYHQHHHQQQQQQQLPQQQHHQSNSFVDSNGYVYSTPCTAMQTLQNGYNGYANGVPPLQQQQGNADLQNTYPGTISYGTAGNVLQNGYPQGANAQNSYMTYKSSSPCVSPQTSMYTNGLPMGPATVRMVSNTTGAPIPMPMHVPPGHMVQQIVDENGTLRHVILSPQMPLQGVPTMPTGPGAYVTNEFGAPPNGGQPPPFYTQYPPAPSPQYHHPHSAPQYSAHGPPPSTHMHPGMGQMHTHPHHQCPNSHHQGPSPPPSGPAPAHLQDERAQKQFMKLRRKIEMRQRDTQYTGIPSSPRKDNGRHAKFRDGNCSTSGLEYQDENSFDDEEDRLLLELISKIRPVKVLDISARSALVQWSHPEDENEEFKIESNEYTYKLFLSDRGKDGKYKIVYHGDLTEYSLKDLKPATEYWICVSALLEEDNLKGEKSESVSFTTIACEPETPQPPKFSNRTKTSIAVKWNSVADNGSKLLGYALECDDGKGDDNYNEVYTGLQRQFKVTRLQASTCYRFRLAAFNDIGKSDCSDPVCISTSGSAPSMPEPPHLKEIQVSKLVLVWHRRPNDDDFTLQMEDESAGHGFMPVYNGRECIYAVGGLRRNTEYRFRLAAHNEEGQSKWSDVVAFRTRPDKPGPPLKAVLKGKIHATSFKVSWDPPKDNGGSDISQFVLEMDSGRGFEVICAGLDTEFLCDHLEPGHTYKLRVSCTSAGGASEFSDVTSITTQAVLPGSCQPPRLQGKPKATSMHLKWSCPSYTGGAPVTEYEVCMTMPDNTTRQVYRGYDTDCAVAGLLPGRVYLFQVRAYNKAGAGQWSDPLEAVSGAGPPDRCKEAHIQAKSPQCVFVTWEEPVNNGATVTDFRLEWLNQKESADFVQLYVGPALSYELKSLSPATQYSFRVQAINSAGAGTFSPISSCTTPPSSPAAITPSSIKYTVTATSITLVWRAPNCNGADISSYNLDVSGNMIAVYDVDLLEYCVENLTPETLYRVRIQAVNSVGVGPFSTPIKIQTRSLPPLPPRLECVTNGYNSLKLKWGDGKNVDFTQYTLEMAGRSGSFSPVYNGTSQVFKVNKLAEHTAYNFRIMAANDAGNGPYSEEYTFNTSKAPPPPIKAPKIWDITETSCKVEWSAVKPMGDDPILYQLQLHSSHDSEFRTIHKGSETSYDFHNLEHKTEYRIRVGTVRVCSDGSGELFGAYSPSTIFTTKCFEPVKPVSSKTVVSQVISERKPLTDQQWAMILVFVFIFLAVIIAIIVQQIISYSRPRADSSS